MAKTSFDVVGYINWAKSPTREKIYRIDHLQAFNGACKTDNLKVFSVRYQNVNEYRSAAYLSAYFHEHKIRTPKPILAFRKYKMMVFEFIPGRLLKDLPTSQKLQALRKALETANLIWQLRPNQRLLALPPLQSTGFELMAQNAFKMAEKVGLLKKLTAKLMSEIRRITKMLSKFDKELVFIHSDFQSRNLLLYRGKIYVTDFERARYGCALWDIASLLYQPALGIDIKDRAQLVATALEESSFSMDDLNLYVLFRLMRGVERRMESLVKESSGYFVKTFPETLKLLEDISRALDLSQIQRACIEIRGKLVQSDPSIQFRTA